MFHASIKTLYLPFMNHHRTIKSGVVVFSQWSRKDYAVFSSLGREVKIGRVSVDISRVSLLKTAVIKELSLTDSYLPSKKENQDDEEQLLPADQLLLMMLMPELLISDNVHAVRIPIIPTPQRMFDHVHNVLFRHPFFISNFMNIDKMTEAIKGGYLISSSEVLELLQTTSSRELRSAADEVRQYFCGDVMDLCSIINARSGRCTEDCKWCSQSKLHSTGIPEYEMVDTDEAVRMAVDNRSQGVNRFSLVTSGRSVGNSQMKRYTEIYRTIRGKSDISLCASMGLLSQSQLRQLKEVGVKDYHCNIETAPSHFSKVCTTHTLEEKVRTIRLAQQEGLKICSGGIIGMGETMEQRIEMALFLRELDVVSIPVNILMPVPGTPMENAQPLTDDEILDTLALFRLINPTANIRFAGGRGQISHRQHEALHSGVSAALVGDYLTTTGSSSIREDRDNFEASGFRFIP